jgi:exodeoxyribonuclease-3
MRLRIASWNVNSVRLRLEHLHRFAEEEAPDVLCLQEIKCETGAFPVEALAEAGFPHLNIQGQKGWHGVAIASRLPLEAVRPLSVCREGHARCVSAKVAGVEIHNIYAPAGGDEPDPVVNAKFAHKLDFFARLTADMAARDARDPLVLCGDLNIAPGEFDVWSHKQMSRVVSHTPVEVEAMGQLSKSLGFIDLAREATPEPRKLASWWSYRAADFRASNRGLRLDHIWVTPGLRQAAFAQGGAAARIHENVRAWERPSDHAPVTADLSL